MTDVTDQTLTVAAAGAAVHEFRLPDVGEGLTEGEILRWLVAVGDTVVVNQPLVEVETAKAAVELPSPYAGTVIALHAAEGAVLAVGAALVSIATGAVGDLPPAADAGDPSPSPTTDTAAVEPSEGSGPVLVGYGVTPGSTRRRPRLAASPHGTSAPEAGPPGEQVKPVRHGGLEVGRAAEQRFADQPIEPAVPVRAKPPVRRMAKDLGVDLARLRATGPDGTVTRADVAAAAALAAPGRSGVAAATAIATQAGPTPYAMPGPRGDQPEPVRGVTRLMADAMTRSAFGIPHVTVWRDVDVTRSVELLARLKQSPAFADARVTPMLLVARAVLHALHRQPICNAVFDAQTGEIVHRGAVHLGIASATPRGLVVAALRDADQRPLPGLAAELTRLTSATKDGSIAPTDLTGSTFTITNVGVFGVDGGTPIINPGESAIVAVGAWRQRPWVVDGTLAVRTVATLSLSFDHRFIDGATGSTFLSDVATLLEEPAADLAW